MRLLELLLNYTALRLPSLATDDYINSYYHQQPHHHTPQGKGHV